VGPFSFCDNILSRAESDRMSILTKDDPDVIDGIYYPSSDGKPMAETGIHVVSIFQLFALLRLHYGSRGDMYIAADMFWYWERGNRKARIAPDIMVNFGVTGNHERRSFMTWRENGVIPSVAFEMAPKGTWRKNLGKTKEAYERLGVKEYFIFDPDYEFLEAPLLGFRLRGKKYFRITADSAGSMMSRELGLRLIPRGRHLRIADPETGALVPTEQERAELERQRADEERRVADEERRAADEERRVADEERRIALEERRRADTLQAEVDRLRAQLQQQKNGKNGNHSRKSS